jgi:hypothetical protein
LAPGGPVPSFFVLGVILFHLEQIKQIKEIIMSETLPKIDEDVFDEAMKQGRCPYCGVRFVEGWWPINDDESEFLIRCISCRKAFTLFVEDITNL